ncbi:MAG: hypothetical protein RLZZ385_696 [Pseudomonadota bacterium]|jgi:CubicO group peptidase (beta-lactamase class C family)
MLRHTRHLTLTLVLLTGFSTALGSAAFAAEKSWPHQEDGAAAAGFSAEGIERLDAAMREVVANQDVAGMVWLLAKDGKVASFDVAGLNSVDDLAPMTKDSLFRIYSMSKPVTGVAMMMLFEEGRWKTCSANPPCAS